MTPIVRTHHLRRMADKRLIKNFTQHQWSYGQSVLGQEYDQDVIYLISYTVKMRNNHLHRQNWASDLKSVKKQSMNSNKIALHDFIEKLQRITINWENGPETSRRAKEQRHPYTRGQRWKCMRLLSALEKLHISLSGQEKKHQRSLNKTL